MLIPPRVGWPQEVRPSLSLTQAVISEEKLGESFRVEPPGDVLGGIENF